jgi:antibiotic biosynthesis monooxygenase (ABM) superfamily enzyme
MIERHVTFNVLSGKESAFEQFIKNEYRLAMAAKEGFVKTGLLRDKETPSQYCMVICFDTLENAAAWRESAEHQALKPKLTNLYSESNLKVFEVIA